MMAAIENFLDHNYWIRIVIMNLPVQLFCVKVLELLLGKIKKSGCLIAFMIVKGAIICYLQALGDNLSLAGRMGEVLIGALSSIAMCLLCFWLCEAEPVKILFAMAISEFAATCSLMSAVVVVIVIERRPEIIFGWYLRFKLTDMLSWGLELVIVLFLYSILKKFKEPFQNYEIRHTRLIWLIYLGYFLLMQTSQVIEIATEEGIRRGLIVPCMIVAAAAVLGLGIAFGRQNEMTKTESQFLQLELSMMQSQYHSMQQQRTRMEECRKLIDSQMQEIIQKGQDAEKKIRTEAYLEDLRNAYQNIRAGIYCRDWTLDSILYVETERAQKEGIHVTCKVQNVPKDQVAVQCMGKVVVELFEYTIAGCQKISDSEKKNIDIQIDVIANQAVVLLTCPVGKRPAEIKKKIGGLIEEREGNVELEKKEGKQRICVRFEE